MSNQFRTYEEEEEENELKALPEIKIRKARPKKVPVESKMEARLFFKKLFSEGGVSKEAATEMLPFLLFLSFLGMLYIGNSHVAMSNIRNIDKLKKEVKELSWDYKSLKADLMFKSKLTEVAKKVDTLGVKTLTEPPRKIIIRNNEH